TPFGRARAVCSALLSGAVGFPPKAAHARLGDPGLLAAGAIAGPTDLAAITLTAARLESAGTGTRILAQAVILAAVSNSVVKSGIAFALGSRDYALRVAAGLLATALVGGATILLL